MFEIIVAEQTLIFQTSVKQLDRTGSARRDAAAHRRASALPLAARIRRCERQLARLYRQRARADARFLVTVARSVQDHAFSVAELVDYARHDPALAAVLAGLRPIQIGQRLTRLARAGHDVAGRRLAYVTRTAEGSVWVFDLHEDASIVPDAGA